MSGTSETTVLYRVENVGARMHQEYWIPAEEMDAFNAAIVGPIEVISEFRGEKGG